MIIERAAFNCDPTFPDEPPNTKIEYIQQQKTKCGVAIPNLEELYEPKHQDSETPALLRRNVLKPANMLTQSRQTLQNKPEK